ncbi:putative quinol monooxygenase [Microbulbifer agarilyticus]|uniref:putative quinol monooxygenase n=1 Tax=Microbulbifer agarilyticus TaxID=260552 RepID=UPI001C9393FD|nr:antibiotic biosynthesis monooxygenase [Microbulbifer agarilyticus]MBY6190063.1 antibiotic biosynthesis monooxygenase [Microbulbifer agarilyticus]MBY6210065.1 antibiotic biosynthesis monooxygenase [Microbulbifer agarilyticus]MCA0892554.1 antibiotic biosynthesis monooxygenase [Microbulbifer agarilyticus]
MGKVILNGYILVPEAELDSVKRELIEHTRLTCAEPGCLKFVVEQDGEEPTRFNVQEEFIDRDAFEHHQERVKNSRWGSLTTNVSRHYTVVG